MTPTVALLAGILTALIPLGVSALLIQATPVDRARELARLMLVMALSVLLLLAGPWVWLTYWMRPAAAVVLAVAVVRSVQRLMAGMATTRAIGSVTILMAAGASGLVVLDVGAVRSGFPADDIISLEFPLRDRTFVVLQGGRSTVTNPFHYASSAGRLSLDIVAVGALGNRVRGLFSHRLSDYFVFGVPVRSPCTGEIVADIDDLADNPPGRPDVRHPPGNHLLLRCDADHEVVVLLGHLQNGSVRKHAGDRVLRGDVIGAVGNSGNSSEPHLHFQASRGDLTKGTAVSILVNGRFLTANNLVFAR